MSDDSIKIEKKFKASIEQIWSAWTEPELVLKWFGSDPNGKGIKAQIDVRPGGCYKITFEDSNKTKHTCMGEYSAVEKFKQLSFTWEWENERDVVSLVIITLSSAHNNTLMIFEHKNVGTASAHNYLTGWKATFSKLEGILNNTSK